LECNSNIRPKRQHLSQFEGGSNIVIASDSEAIQGHKRRAGLLPPSLKSYGGQVVARAPRNDVAIQFRVLAALIARGLQEHRDPQERAQGRPGARCTRGLACKGREKGAHEHTGSAEAVRPSLRNGFTAYFALSPVTGFLATVVLKKLASQET
jgi:hypothetical protein